MRLMKSALSALLVGALLLVANGARAAEPLKIRYGWIVLPASWGPLLLEKKAMMGHFGKSYLKSLLLRHRHSSIVVSR